MRKIFLDTETTGLSSINNRICSLTVIDDDNNIKNYLFNPQQHVQPGAAAVNGYSWNMLKKYPTFAEQAREIRAVLDSADAIVAHNAVFDIRFLQKEFERCGIYWRPKSVICTMKKAKGLITTHSYRLDNLTSILGLKNLRGEYHGSCVDAIMCKALYERLCGVRQSSVYNQQPVCSSEACQTTTCKYTGTTIQSCPRQAPNYSSGNNSGSGAFFWFIIVIIILILSML